jgi:hypothetical protein
MRILRRFARTIVWGIIAAALALGGAGLVAQLSHPPGGASRAELTYAGDQALGAQISQAAVELRSIEKKVETLAADARSALEAVGGADAATIRAALDKGGKTASAITGAVRQLRSELSELPGDSPTAALQYNNDLLVRRAALFAALDAAGGLSDQWSRITDRSARAAELTIALDEHESTVAEAAAQGRAAKYPDALATLAHASSLLDQADQLRAELLTASDQTTLDDWLARHRRYDTALTTLYTTLQASGGLVTKDVEVAYHEENVARAELPIDSRALIVIVAEIARGGLNQAVIAIEDARGRINTALQEFALT